VSAAFYSLSPPLSGRRGASLDAVHAALAGSLRDAPPGFVLAPAGVSQVEDDDCALEVAESLRAAVSPLGAALAFAIDVGPPRPGSIRLFACQGGTAVTWPAIGGKGCPIDLGGRVLRSGKARVLVLAAAEALDPAAPRRVAAAGALDAVAVLSHGGATVRWAPALARLERVAPIIIAAHHGGAGRAYATPSLGVRWLSLPEPPCVQQQLSAR
jgi:hypothetical protein